MAIEKIKLLSKHKELLKYLKDLVINFYKDNLISLVIFGSVARGVATEESDVDLMIIAEDLPDGRVRRISQFEDLEFHIKKLCKFNFFLSPIIKTKEEVLKGSPLFWDMLDSSIILYDKEGFFEKYLLKVKEKLEKRTRIFF
jgi:predicted nucleotidyltransferase